jgi:hypothetical protein
VSANLGAEARQEFPASVPREAHALSGPHYDNLMCMCNVKHVQKQNSRINKFDLLGKVASPGAALNCASNSSIARNIEQISGISTL